VKSLILWIVALVLASSIGYSAVLANREKQPPTAAPAEACRVTSYSLNTTGSMVSTTVVCEEAGRYRVSASVSASGEVSSGGVTVNLSQDLPAIVNVNIAPTFPSERELYQVRVLVEKA
jgi:hypothetical protein